MQWYWFQPFVRRMKKEYTTELHFTSITSEYGATDVAKRIPIKTTRFSKIRVIFVYGSDFVRASSTFDMFYFWNGGYFWVLTSLLLIAMCLYSLRRRIGFRRVDFVVAFLEVFSLVFGGGNIQYRHRWEKWFFAVGLTASFFLVTIYLADFSMHSLLNRGSLEIDSFGKLAKRNVTFHLGSNIMKEKAEITEILRLENCLSSIQ